MLFTRLCTKRCFWRLYAKPYWKIIHFLSRQKTAKTFNVPRGNFSIYFWKLLFLANCIIRNLQLSRDHVRYINSFLVMYYLFFTSNNGVNKIIRTYICGTFIWTDSGRHHPECLWNPPFSPKNLTLTCYKWWKMGLVRTAHFWTVWYWGNSFLYNLVFILPKNASPPKKMKK